jgi:hypothetical protein
LCRIERRHSRIVLSTCIKPWRHQWRMWFGQWGWGVFAADLEPVQYRLRFVRGPWRVESAL